MNLSIIPPSFPLQPHVESIKILSKGSELEADQFLTGYPTGYTDLVISFRENPEVKRNQGTFEQLPDIALVGHFDHQFKISLPAEVEAIWMRMKPHAAFALTGIHSRKFHDQITSLKDISPTQIRALQQQLSACESMQERIPILEIFVQEQIERNYRPDSQLEFIIEQINSSKGQIRLKAICESLTCNYRTLDRLFWKKIGQSPKRFLQNIRFKHILEDLRRSKDQDWMQLVADHGFHDQAHLIKEFQKYTASSPQTFMKERYEVGKSLYA
ncbi:MAG: helix-turn-helix domain-containing protein [Bacteroidota bacterium]